MIYRSSFISTFVFLFIDFTSGEIVNLMGIDIQRIVEYIVMANLVWSSTVQIIIAIALIWQQLGLATIGIKFHFFYYFKIRF